METGATPEDHRLETGATPDDPADHDHAGHDHTDPDAADHDDADHDDADHDDADHDDADHDHADHGDADHGDAGHDHAAHDHAAHDHAAHDHAAHADEHDHAPEVRLTAEAVERNRITIANAQRRRLNPTFVAPARVAFNTETMAHVGSTLPGRIAELHVRLGDVVTKGEALLVVESPELGEAQSEYLQKRILAETAAVSVDLAHGAYDRARRLYEENRGIALEEVQRREAEFKVAEAGLLTAQSATLAAENKLHLLGMSQDAVDELRDSGEVNPRFTIVAPIGGEVVERNVTLGELVSSEREQLLVLADVHSLWVLADIPEAHLPEIARGADAWIDAGALDAHKHQGEVSYVAPMIDPRTRTVAVRVAVECDDRSLKPGMFVEVEIASIDRRNRHASPLVVVSAEAVQSLEGRTVVFVPSSDRPNTFMPRTVSIGKPVGALVPVYAGLEEGEPYVASGSFLLKADLGKGAAEHQH